MVTVRIKMLLVLLANTFAGVTCAEDWPMWRGPRGDGINLGDQAPLTWSPTENIAWKTPVPGIGRSSPIVLDDHVFLTTASSTPAADQKRVYVAFNDDQGLFVAALDRAGNVLWTVSPGTFLSNHGFAASPALYGPGVIVNGHQDGSAFVVMLDRATGQELWRYTPSVSIRSFSTPIVVEHDGDIS